MKQVFVIEIDFIPPPSQIIAKVAADSALGGDRWRQRRNRKIVRSYRREWPVVVWIFRIDESVMVQVISTRGFPLVLKSSE